MKIERFECFHYGRLMLIILSTHLLRYCRHLNYKKFQLETSELKFFKLIVSMKQLIKASIRKSRNKLTEFLDSILAVAEKTCIRTKAESPSTIENNKVFELNLRLWGLTRHLPVSSAILKLYA